MSPPDAERPAYARGESIFVPLQPQEAPLQPDPDWAWGGATGRGVRVAVIDSGIDAAHPALDGCVDTDAGVVLRMDRDGEIVVDPGPHEDAFGHGTACAAIIHKLAPEARITSVRVLGPTLGGRAAVFLHGLAWAIENGYDVINLSLGTSKRDWALPFHELCDRAYFRGSFIVTAANNVAETSFPSLYASVASVACSVSREPFDFYANPAPPTDFLAPGIDLDVAWRGGGTRRVTGNSYAAPHIAGVVALIRSKHPELRPFQVKAVLWATAANVHADAAPSVRPPLAAPSVQPPLATPIVSARSASAVHAIQIVPLDGGPERDG